MTARRRCGRSDGFTLVELLVAVVVLSVLATMAVSSFTMVRSRAHDSVTSANLRTVGHAVSATRLGQAADSPWPVVADMAMIEPSLTYAEGTSPSTGSGVISVEALGDRFVAAALSGTGRCLLHAAWSDGSVSSGVRPDPCIGRYGQAGVVTTVAGSTAGSADGTGAAAQFFRPSAVAVDAAGVMYVADRLNHRIRRITPAGEVTTIAGGTQGFADGTGAAARFDHPAGITLGPDGNLYVSDYMNNRIRRVALDGAVTTFAGPSPFSWPSGLAFDRNGMLYVADWNNHRIRVVTPNGVVSTFAGSGIGGTLDGPAAAARFQQPADVAVDDAGDVYVVDYASHRVRRISNGVVTTLAGSTQGFADGVGPEARFNLPYGIAVDAVGAVYVADFNNHRIRRITPSGQVTTVAGSTVGVDDGTGTAARFDRPLGVVVDSSGALIVAEFGNNRIRRIG
jgi:prepilin-type N-terminal cleavage/methylation domain-containing protein